MRHQKTTWIVFFYALSILIGGVVGYVHSASKPSLIAGLFFGAFLLLASLLMFQRKILGKWLALILAILLEGFFTWRFGKTLHFLPSGLLSLMSLIVIILVALKIGKQIKEKRTH